MARKSKEFRLAEIAYWHGLRHGLRHGLSREEDEPINVEAGAKTALALWKEETGGKKPKPTDVDLARKEWEKAGRPTEGVMYRGARYIFEPDGDHDLTKNFFANFGSAAKAGE